MGIVTVSDGTQIYYKDWGSGPAVVLSHGWPLSSDDGPFFGNDRPEANVSEGTRLAFWRQGLQSGHRNACECIAAFSATDFRSDLAKFDVPTLVIHGDDDQVVPFSVGGQASAALIDGATLKVYPGAPHGITDTHKEQLGTDLLAFLNSTLERTTDEQHALQS